MQSRVKYKKGRVTDKLLPMLKLMVVQVWKLLHKGETCLPCPAVFLHCELWTGCKKCLTLACFHDPVQPSLVTRIATSLCISSLYLVVKKKSVPVSSWIYGSTEEKRNALAPVHQQKSTKSISGPLFIVWDAEIYPTWHNTADFSLWPRQNPKKQFFFFYQDFKSTWLFFYNFSLNPFVVSYPWSAHIWVLSKYYCSPAQNQLCSSAALISLNWSGSILCHFKEH